MCSGVDVRRCYVTWGNVLAQGARVAERQLHPTIMGSRPI
jgi:hypothetical protein